MFQNYWFGNVQAVLQRKHNFVSFLSFWEVLLLHLFRIINILSAWFSKGKERKNKQTKKPWGVAYVNTQCICSLAGRMPDQFVFRGLKQFKRTGQTGINPALCTLAGKITVKILVCNISLLMFFHRCWTCWLFHTALPSSSWYFWLS